MLSIAIEKKFTKSHFKMYAWLLMNANPYNGQVTSDDSLEDVAELLKISIETTYRVLNDFQEQHVYLREMNAKNLAIVKSIRGNVPHIELTHADESRYQKLTDEGKRSFLDADPRANLIYGKLPRTFLEIAIENNFKPSEFRHYWWIALNISDKPGEGWLTKKEDVPDLANHLDLSVHRLLQTFRRFSKTGLFIISKPAHIQGTAPHIVEAAEEVRRIGREKAYKDAEKKYIKSEREKKKNWKISWDPAHEKMYADIFREHFEETGEFLPPVDENSD